MSEEAGKDRVKGLEHRTCLECYQNTWCHPVFAVCEACWRKVWVPALGEHLKCGEK